MFSRSAAMRFCSTSLQNITPPRMYAAVCVALPPGAEHRSSTRVPINGANAATAALADGSCM